MWDLPPPDPAFEIVAASRGMSKGLAQTDGPQVIPKAFLNLGPVQLGAQWKNVSSPAAHGEGAAFISYAPKVGPYQLTLAAAYKFQTGLKGVTGDDSFEFTAAGSRKFGKVTWRASAIYSPDDIGAAQRSLYLEGGSSLDLDQTTRLSLNLARRSRSGAPDYTAFNAGLSKTLFGKLTVDLRYHDTAQNELGAVYRRRVVVSAKTGF